MARTNPQARLFQGIADEKVGPTHFLLTCLNAEANEAVNNEAVVRYNLLKICFLLAQITGRSSLLQRVPCTPFVAITSVDQDTHSCIVTNFEIGATRNVC